MVAQSPSVGLYSVVERLCDVEVASSVIDTLLGVHQLGNPCTCGLELVPARHLLPEVRTGLCCCL
jgi:hypothetical protein